MGGNFLYEIEEATNPRTVLLTSPNGKLTKRRWSKRLYGASRNSLRISPWHRVCFPLENAWYDCGAASAVGSICGTVSASVFYDFLSGDPSW